MMPVCGSVSAQNITTIAGGGNTSGEYVGSQIGDIDSYSIAKDNMGNIFVADENRVRKITPAGVIYTVAGTGEPGHTGDGGAATSAKLQDISNIAVDGAGNLYIAEFIDVIRKVNTAGIISTIAGVPYTPGYTASGNPAAGGQITDPWGICADAAGNVFFTMPVGLIGKISASGIYTSVGGGGGGTWDGMSAMDATIAYPRSIQVNTAGELFVVTQARLRKINTSGLIYTVMGNGTPGNTGDGGDPIWAKISLYSSVALDPTGDIYVTMPDYNVVRKINVAANVVNVYAGTGAYALFGDGGPATAAGMSSPVSMAYSGTSMYIATSGNRVVRRVDAAGNISTYAGNGFEKYNGDWNAANNARLMPRGLLLDTAGNCFFADELNNSIRCIDTADTVVRIAGNEVLGTPTPGSVPAFTAALPAVNYLTMTHSGDIYFTNNITLYRIGTPGTLDVVVGDGLGGDAGDGGPGYWGRVNGAAGIACDTADNIYFADMNNQRIRKLSATNILSTIAGTGTAGFSGDGGPASAAQLSSPNGLAYDAIHKYLYIADAGNHRIRKISGSGVITTVAGNGTGGYTGDGGAATAAAIEVHSVAVDDTGNVYFTDSVHNVIRKVTTTGSIHTIAGTGTAGMSGDGGPAIAATFSGVHDLKADHAGNLYVADNHNHRIRYICASNDVTPGIAIAASDTAVCAGTFVTLTETHTVAGTLPQIQWIKNGSNIAGATNSTYASAGLADGDVLECRITYGVPAKCATSSTATSAAITMTITPTAAAPTISSVVASPDHVSYAGEPITYTATYSGAGATPTFQWSMNSVPIPGATTNPYVTNTVTNSDIVSVTITTSLPCAWPTSSTMGTALTAAGVAASHRQQLAVYPNPCNGRFFIKGSLQTGEADIQICTVTGKVVYRKLLHTINGELNEEIDLHTCCGPGFYLLRMMRGDATENYHVVVQ